MDLHTNSEADIAWAAGLFEGEGCICVTVDRYRRPRVVMSMGMTDFDVVMRFHAVIGTGATFVRKRQDPKHNEMLVWQVSGNRSEPPIRLLLPWFGVRRKAKAMEALEAIAQLGPWNGEKTHCNHGHPYDEANTIRNANGSRACRICTAVWNKKRPKVKRA